MGDLHVKDKQREQRQKRWRGLQQLPNTRRRLQLPSLSRLCGLAAVCQGGLLLGVGAGVPLLLEQLPRNAEDDALKPLEKRNEGESSGA